MKRLMLASAVLAALLPSAGMARGRVGVFVGPTFAPWGWYGPGFYGYGYGPYYGVPNAGQVKLDSKVKDGQVFVNGNYAGVVHDLKSMWMRPGDYNIEVREPGREPFRASIHVLAGKTMKLHPDDAPIQNPTGS